MLFLNDKPKFNVMFETFLSIFIFYLIFRYDLKKLKRKSDVPLSSEIKRQKHDTGKIEIFFSSKIFCESVLARFQAI